MTNKNEAVAHPLSRREVLGAGLGLGGSALAVTISARALGLSPAIAKVPEKIVIGQVPFNTQVTIYAEAIGALKEEGLAVEYLKAVGGPAVIQALAAGGIPVGEPGFAPALIAAARKIPLVSPALGGIGTPTHPFSRIMTLADSPIRSVADLKGKKIALHQRGLMEDLVFPALKMNQPDSGIGVSLHEILPEAERAVAEIRNEIGDVDNGSRIELLLGDGIDRRACKDGVDQPLAQRLGLVGRRDQNDFDILSADAMMKAWIRTCRWIDDNAVQANTVAGAALGITEEVRPHLRLPYFARNGLAVLPNVWHIYYMLVAGKVLDPVDDPGRLIEQSVVEPAKRMGLPALDAVGQQPDPEVIDMLRAPYALLPNSLETYYSDWERALVRA